MIYQWFKVTTKVLLWYTKVCCLWLFGYTSLFWVFETSYTEAYLQCSYTNHKEKFIVKRKFNLPWATSSTSNFTLKIFFSISLQSNKRNFLKMDDACNLFYVHTKCQSSCRLWKMNKISTKTEQGQQYLLNAR